MGFIQFLRNLRVKLSIHKSLNLREISFTHERRESRWETPIEIEEQLESAAVEKNYKIKDRQFIHSCDTTTQRAPDTARILCWSFTPKHHRQLRVKDLPKVSTWRLERESNP